jgi:drug/metabolite transporter, DME family
MVGHLGRATDRRASGFRYGRRTTTTAAREQSRRGPQLLVIAAAVLWGTTGTARALGAEDADPSSVGAVRLILGGAVLVAVAARRGWMRSNPVRSWPRLPTAGAALAMAAYQPLFFGAVSRTGVAVGTVVGIGSAPVFAGLLGLLRRGERPDRRWLVATSLAVTGASLLVGGGDPTEVDAAGVGLALGAGCTYAVYVLCTKLLLDRGLPSDGVVAGVFGLAGVLLIPVAVVTGVGPLLDGQGLLTAAWLGVVTVAVAYLLFGRGLTGVGVATAGTLTLAEPATAATLGLVVLDERVTGAALVGLALVAAGLVVLALRPRADRRGRDRGPPRAVDPGSPRSS